MLEFVCTFILLWIIVSAVWPDPRKKQREDDRRHAETLAAIRDVTHQRATPAVPATPEYSPAHRARVIALGRVRDRENGQPRHPILDSEPTLVSAPVTPEAAAATKLSGVHYSDRSTALERLRARRARRGLSNMF